MTDPDTTAQDEATLRNYWCGCGDGLSTDALAALDRLTARIATLEANNADLTAALSKANEVNATALARAEFAEDLSEALKATAVELEARAEQAERERTAQSIDRISAERERDEAVALLREVASHRTAFRGTVLGRNVLAFLSRLSTEGEPAEDRCPTCGRDYSAFGADSFTCSDPWHTTPKEDRDG